MLAEAPCERGVEDCLQERCEVNEAEYYRQARR